MIEEYTFEEMEMIDDACVMCRGQIRSDKFELQLEMRGYRFTICDRCQNRIDKCLPVTRQKFINA